MVSWNEQPRKLEEAREAMQAAQPHNQLERLRYSYEELLDQPAAIRQTLTLEQDGIEEVARYIAGNLERRIFGIGCGDSWYTTQAVRAPIEQLLAVPFEPLQALEFTRYAAALVGPGDVVIGLSASGTTAETAQGLAVARAAGAYTVGITMRQDSPFAEIPHRYLLAHAIRRASFPTQASTTGLALLLALAAETALRSGKHLDQAHQLKRWLIALPTLVAKIIEDSQGAAMTLAPQWIDHDLFTFVGAGPGLAAAMFGSAKILEGCHAIGRYIGTEEFHHYHFVREGDPVFLVAPDDPASFRANDVAQDVKRSGGVLYSVVSNKEKQIAGISASTFRIPATPSALIGLPYTIPLQLAAWHISQAKALANSPT